MVWIRWMLVSVQTQEPVLYGRSIRRNIIFGLEGTPDEPSEEEIINAAKVRHCRPYPASRHPHTQGLAPLWWSLWVLTEPALAGRGSWRTPTTSSSRCPRGSTLRWGRAANNLVSPSRSLEQLAHVMYRCAVCVGAGRRARRVPERRPGQSATTDVLVPLVLAADVLLLPVLSMSQKQRIAIARALCRQPSVLLLDGRPDMLSPLLPLTPKVSTLLYSSWLPQRPRRRLTRRVSTWFSEPSTP